MSKNEITILSLSFFYESSQCEIFWQNGVIKYRQNPWKNP